ncbi:MAG: hypothetical protein PHR30_16445 [Gallionellaceae bacterium]|nr:hypothetical protein [Gallionellaceae bacterium]
MAAFEITFSGYDELTANLKAIAAGVEETALQAVREQAEGILLEAVKLVPEDTGTLMHSGIVEKITDAGHNVLGFRISFGGAASAYALAVHEHLSKYSPASWVTHSLLGKRIHWTRPGSGPKYLERPFLAAAPSLPEKVAARIRDLLMRQRGR